MDRVGDPNPSALDKTGPAGCESLAIPRSSVMLTRDDRTPAFLMADREPAAVVGVDS